jgi:ubiquitin carboxyl-terminal hydrolase 4/11/15
LISAQLLAIDQFNHRIYAYWPDDKAVHEARSNDVIVLHEVAVPVSQSEQGTRTLDPTTIVVPVFMTTQHRGFGHPMFVALNKQQRTEVMSICRAVVNACMALVREDKADGLFASVPAAEGDAATSTSPSPRSQKLKTGLYELFIEKQNRFTINKRSSGMFSGEPGNNQETLGDRLKPKLMNRITNGLSGMISSAPNSDDEDEGAKPLIWPSEAITLDWKPEAANEFFGPDRLGRYATDRDYEHVEDPDIATERQKEGRKGTLSLDDCLNEFSKPEVLGEHDLWYCSNVSLLEAWYLALRS